MGRKRARQLKMFASEKRDLVQCFYGKLNELLVAADFDGKVERLCASAYSLDTARGQPSIPPGIFFRLMMVGYLEGIASDRSIAWRASDSISIRKFLGVGLYDETPCASTLSRTRRLLPLATFERAFEISLSILANAGLYEADVIGVDSTMLQAKASMKCLRNAETTESYSAFARRIAEQAEQENVPAQASGESASEVTKSMEPPNSASLPQDAVIRHDRKRKKTMSNEEWSSESDPDARIARMKNGTTRLAYKAEHVVDIKGGFILAASLYRANEHDTATLAESLRRARLHQARVSQTTASMPTLVADKGYHKVSLLLALSNGGYKTVIPAPRISGKRRFDDKGGEAAKNAFDENQSRVASDEGKRLLRLRGEFLERPNQHLYDRGQLRSVHIVGLENLQKRVLVHAMAFNLSGLMRKKFGVGTPKRAASLRAFILTTFLSDRLYRRLLVLQVGVAYRNLIGDFAEAFDGFTNTSTPC